MIERVAVTSVAGGLPRALARDLKFAPVVLVLVLALGTSIRAQESSDSGFRRGSNPASGAASREDDGGGEQSSVRAGETTDAAPQASAQESFLSWMFHSSGAVRLVSLVIAAMSFYLFALVIWMALHYRTTIAVPRALVRELQELLDQKKYSEAYHRLIADQSLLARILAAGVRKLPSGLPLAQRASSWPTKTPPWRWSTAPPIWRPWARSGR